MPARAVDADEDTQVHTEPLGVRGTTVSALVVARQTANLENDALHTVRQSDKIKSMHVCVHALITQKSSNHCTMTGMMDILHT